MRHNKRIQTAVSAAVVLLTLFIFACASASEITAVPSNAQVVDVRTSNEFKAWHYPNAINIPVDVLEKNLDKLDDNRPIIVYCRSGNRSTTAKKILLSKGYTNVKNGGGLGDMEKFLP